MSEELKPCPFCSCGTVELEVVSMNNESISWVHCNGCSACGPEIDTKENAVKFWNTRAPQSDKEGS